MTTKPSSYVGRLLIASLFLMEAGSALAQRLESSARRWDFGVTGVISRNSSTSTWPYVSYGRRAPTDLKSKLRDVGWAAGMYADRTFNRKWSGRLDLQYLNTSFRNDLMVTANTSDGSFSIRYLQATMTARYAPFWRSKEPFWLVMGTHIQVPVGYRDYLLATIDPLSRPPTDSWIYSYTTKPDTQLLPLLGLQLGAAFQHNRFGFQLSYNFTLTPSMRITPPAASVSHHRFSSVQFSTSYSLFRK